jgi:hypothetical protein
MGDYELLEKLRDKILELKIVTGLIKRETRRSTLERTECKHFLFRISSSLQYLKEFVNNYSDYQTLKSNEKSDLLKLLLSEFVQISKKGKMRSVSDYYDDYNLLLDDIIDIIEYTASVSDSRSSMGSTGYSTSESVIRNKIYNYINAIEPLLDRINERILKPSNRDISDTNRLEKFIIWNPMNLDENWLIAVSYLSMIDILVLRKREDFGLSMQIKKDFNLPFDQKFDGLINELKERMIKIDSKVLGFQKMLRDFRTQVIHYGYCPNRKELDLIVEYSEKTILALSSLKTKK